MLVRMAQETMIPPIWQLPHSDDSPGLDVAKHILLEVGCQILGQEDNPDDNYADVGLRGKCNIWRQQSTKREYDAN